MCITIGKAKLSETIVYAAEREYQGKTVHVLGYQNKAENYERGSNAMILPIPAVALGAENGIDMSESTGVLKAYSAAIRPPVSRGGMKGLGGMRMASRGIEVSVFKSGSYTVVVANEPRVLPAVVKSLDESIEINSDLMEVYSKAYEGWRVAVCLFEKRIEAEPLAFWYEPLYPSHLFVPTLDAHDGRAPRDSADLDHSIVFGAGHQGSQVHWGSRAPSKEAAPFFSDHVIGFELHGRFRNGDQWLRTEHAKALTTAQSGGATIQLPAGVRP